MSVSGSLPHTAANSRLDASVHNYHCRVCDHAQDWGCAFLVPAQPLSAASTTRFRSGVSCALRLACRGRRTGTHPAAHAPPSRKRRLEPRRLSTFSGSAHSPEKSCFS